MEDIRKVRIEEVCEEVTVGHVGPMSKEYIENGVVFLRSQNIKPFFIDTTDTKRISSAFNTRLRKSILHKGDVVVVRTGYPGTAAVVPGELDGSNCADLVIFRPSSELNPHYLEALLNSKWGQRSVKGHLVGAAQQHFNIGQAKNLQINLPPREIQDKVSFILTRYQEAIRNNRKRIRLAVGISRLLYDEWFTRFRFPGREGVRMVDSQIGKLPQDWQVVGINDLAELQFGFPFEGRLFSQDKSLNPVVRIRDLPDDSTDTYTSERADNKYLLQNGDFLIGMDGIFHMCKWSGGRAYMNQRVARLRPRNGVSPSFLFHGVKPKIEDLNNEIVGTTVQHLSKEDFEHMRFALPTPSIMESFGRLADKLYFLEVNLTQKNRNLALTRDIILPSLISDEANILISDIKVTGEGI